MSSTPLELSGNARAHFLTWADEAVKFSGNAHAYSSGAGYLVYFQIGMDGTAQPGNRCGSGATSTGAWYCVPLNITEKAHFISEGCHYIVPCGSMSNGIGIFYGTSIMPTIVSAL
jgi:hypothetical protein